MGMQNPSGKPDEDMENVGRLSGPEEGQSQSLPKRVLFDPSDNSHLAHIPTIAMSDSNGLLRAHRHYRNSWKQRGGIGAFMMLARKWDRLENACEEHGYDIFKVMAEDTRGEGIIDDIRDLRRYLLLVEAEATARGLECCSVRHRDNLEETARATERHHRDDVVVLKPATNSALQVMRSPEGREVIRRLVDGDPAINAADDRHEAQARIFKEAFGSVPGHPPGGHDLVAREESRPETDVDPGPSDSRC